MRNKNHVALYWDAEGDKVRCELCPHRCLLGDGQVGLCRVRKNINGQLIADGYGCISSENVDPIEKKPLNQFHPGEKIYSIGGWGCNFSCSFCQNWTISQQVRGSRGHGADSGGLREGGNSPAEIVEHAIQSGGVGIAYTYNEPLISFEFVRDCCILSRAAGLKNVLVTNGYINREPAEKLLPLIDALNIDIKSMDDSFYVKRCGGHLQPVLDFAVQAISAGCHVEITNLLIPGLNDADELIESLAEWIMHNLGRGTPLHLSAYYPQFKLRVPATTFNQVEHAKALALRYLAHVYMGNV